MAKVFLACEAKVSDHRFSRRDFERLSHYSSIDRVKKHHVVDDPSVADIVVFVGSSKPNYSDITRSSLYKSHKEKSVIFDSGDRGIPILPGCYACLENNWTTRVRKSALSGFYLRVTDNDSLDNNVDINSAKYLFSFVGNALNHPVRREICQMSSDRSYLRDSSDDARQQDDGIIGENQMRGIHYCDVMTQSKFSLCPRGVGVSSWRLFETMRAGRVPVIISDNWIPPLGPRWESFSLSVKEGDVSQLPEFLEEKEQLAVSFGANARAEWERWYSKENLFTTVIDLLLVARSNYNKERGISRIPIYGQYLKPFYFRHWVISPIRQRVLGSG